DAGLVLAGTGAFLQFQAFADPTLEDCLNAELNSVSNLDGMGTLRTAPSADSLEPGAGSESAFKKATLELSNGPIDVFVYVECRPLGTEIDGNPMALVIRFIIVQDAYSDLQDPLQELLDGITLTN
ncbi:MAG TPA: hypothetical protein PK819_05160, partial [Thermomicrobiales bacterium]|nr:hypothetical protein [Thermomicrobiales bacterium]